MMADDIGPSYSMPAFIREYFSGKALLNAVEQVAPELWLLKPHQIQEHFSPSTIDYLIQERLWYLLVTIPTNKKIKTTELHKDICSYTNFYNHVLSNPYRLVWYFAPMQDLNSKIGMYKSVLVQKLKTIIELPIFDENGSPAYRNMEQIRKVSTLLFRDIY